MIKDNFHTVCSWIQFANREEWIYDLFLGWLCFILILYSMGRIFILFYNFIPAKNPVPIPCPVAGKYKFKQKGDVPFITRILGGVTQSPRPNIYCKENISDLSVCDTEQKEMWIDENYCLSVDHRGRPVDIYSKFVKTNRIFNSLEINSTFFSGDPDYKMKCIGFWKENLKSYLITYDELDAFTKYRCWVNTFDII